MKDTRREEGAGQTGDYRANAIIRGSGSGNSFSIFLPNFIWNFFFSFL